MERQAGLRSAPYDFNQRPFIVIWETTRACQLACKHCRATAIPGRNPGELSTSEAKRLLDEIAAFGTPRPLVILTGGDPFQRPDLFEIVEYGASLGLPMSASPSATPLLNFDNLKRLKDAGAKAMSLSLDGSTAEIHDAFRGVPGSYELTRGGWNAALQLGLRLQINTTLTRYNLNDLPDIFKRVRERGAMMWSLFLLIPTGRGKELAAVEPHEIEDVLHFLYDAGHYFQTKTVEGHHYKRVVLQRLALEGHRLDTTPEEFFGLGETYLRLRKQLLDYVGGETPNRPRPPMTVNSAKGFVFISHLGDVCPSGFFPMPAGNVRRDSLVSAYRDAPLFKSLRDPQNLKGKCAECEFKTICLGSRSRAFCSTNDMFAQDPLCSYIPGTFPVRHALMGATGAQ